MAIGNAPGMGARFPDSMLYGQERSRAEFWISLQIVAGWGRAKTAKRAKEWRIFSGGRRRPDFDPKIQADAEELGRS
jgi:hypothetical protein